MPKLTDQEKDRYRDLIEEMLEKSDIKWFLDMVMDEMEEKAARAYVTANPDGKADSVAWFKLSRWLANLAQSALVAEICKLQQPQAPTQLTQPIPSPKFDNGDES